MGSCIICGTSVDGRICDVHEEDVVFEFRGTSADELSPSRFYRGTVDGYAEFGIFVDIGDRVTGLLHKSELDQRLESLDWDPGDTVFVQVKNVRDNGNVDLGWSIRQRERDFRGTLVDDPEVDHAFLAEEEDEPETATDGEGGDVTVTPASDSGGDRSGEDRSAEQERGTGSQTAERQSGEGSAGTETATREAEELTVDVLEDNVGSLVRLEGEIVDAHQTSGPTVFQLRDETGSVECAAFEEAGVRAYPEVDEGDVVRIEGEVEERRSEIQVETEGLVVLEDDERDAVTERMEDAMVHRARPEAVDPLADDDAVEAVAEDLRDAATSIRRAVLEGRPVVVRHSATVDGYVGGAAIERATLPLIDREHTDADAEYHYFDRRPLEGSVYDMDDATKDVTTMLSNRERHDEDLPLFVFVAAGGTEESLDGYELLDLYGARTLVVEAAAVDDAVADAVDLLVSAADDSPETTATALAANVAAHVDDAVRDDLAHLPAVSFWENAPPAYDDLANDAGYDVDEVREIREAIALEAYYQSYEDKRELIVDLLFAEADADQTGLAGHVGEQYRQRMDAAVETADANLETVDRDGTTLLVLDTEAYTHRYEFPGADLLLDELHRRHRDEADALVGLGEDEAFLRSDADLDVRSVVADASDEAPSAGLDARGAREGRVEFLSGERAAVRDALLNALDHELSSKAAA